MISSALEALYRRPVLLLFLTALFWASNAIAGQLARGEITPMQHVLIRWIMITGLVWPVFGRQVIAHWPAARPHIVRIVIMAMLGFTGFNMLFYIASFNTTGVNIGILQGSVPVFVVIGAFVWHRAQLSARQIVGVLITLVGVAVVATKGAPWLVLGIALNFGDVMMLCACASYAVYAVMLRDRPAMPGGVFFALMCPIAIITALPPAVYEAMQPGYVLPTLNGWLITLFVSIFPGALAQQFFLRGVDLIGPGRAGVYTNLVPVFAAGLAVLILGETFAAYHLAALVLVLGGIALAQTAKS